MDVVEFIQGLNLFDILVAFFVAGFFVVGYVQGTLRRLLGLGILLFSVLLAMNLRDPLGAWLAQYWVHLPRPYVDMLALGVSFVAIYLAGSITVQTFYRRTPLWTRAAFLDELCGGILGAIQALILVGMMILVLDTYFALPGYPAHADEIGFLRDVYNFYNVSQVVDLFRMSLIPLFLALFGWIIPDSLEARFG